MGEQLATEPINEAVKEHEVAADEWTSGNSLLRSTPGQRGSNDIFALKVLTPAIRLDHLSLRTLGMYRPGRSGFGLRYEVSLNVAYSFLPLPRQLCILVHELIHQWQDLYGQPSKNGHYHNRQYRI